MNKKNLDQKTRTGSNTPHDWRKDMQGATPEKLARALLRPVGKNRNLASHPQPEPLK